MPPTAVAVVRQSALLAAGLLPALTSRRCRPRRPSWIAGVMAPPRLRIAWDFGREAEGTQPCVQPHPAATHRSRMLGICQLDRHRTNQASLYGDSQTAK